MPTHPGVSIALLMTDAQVTPDWMAERLGLSLAQLTELLARERPLTEDIANRLVKCFALPADWWLDRERESREYIAHEGPIERNRA